MPKGKKKKGGSTKPKKSKGASANAVVPDAPEGSKTSNPCAKCHSNEGTHNDTCQHRFCPDCYDSLMLDGMFKCFLCQEGEAESPRTSGLALRYEQAPPETKVLGDFVSLNKGIKKLLSFTHQTLDTVERVIVDRNETFICVNPVDHKIYLFNKLGKYVRGVKYLFNHGFTGGVAMTHDGNFLVTLQGSKSTSVCFYTPDGKFRTSSFFQKGCYSHSIAVGAHNAIFALDAESRALHFFNRDKKMCQSWTLQSVLAHGIDLWDCSLHITKDDKLLLFDAVKCQLFEIVGDDAVELKVSFADQASLPDMSDDGSVSSMSHQSQSMWTKKRLVYDSDDESEKGGEKLPPKAEEVIPLRPTSAGIKLDFISEVNEISARSNIEPAPAGQLPPIDGKPSKGGKKGKKGKGGKKGKKGNPNKNNNANGHVAFEDEQGDPNDDAEKELEPLKEDVGKEEKLSIIDLSDEDASKQSEPVSQSDIPVSCSTPVQLPVTVNLVDKFIPRNHPPIMAVDIHDCLLFAHQGKISLFSPDGQFIKKILELNEDTDDNKFKVTIKYMVPFGLNRLAVLWHKHRARIMSKFFEVYSYNVPRKYRRSKSAYGTRKYTYDYDDDFEDWAASKQQSTCCVVQ